MSLLSTHIKQKYEAGRPIRAIEVKELVMEVEQLEQVQRHIVDVLTMASFGSPTIESLRAIILKTMEVD